MKKKQIRKNVYFGILLTTLMISTVFLASDTIAVTPTEIFDTEFDTQVEALMNPAKVESLALSVIEDTGDDIDVFHSKGYGEQPGTDIVYYINQISGLIAVTALLQLMDDGLFDLDDPVNDYLPWTLVNPNYPSTDITIRHILSWKAGLSNASFYNTVVASLVHPFPDILYEVFNEAGSNYTSTVWKNWAPGSSFTTHYTYYDFAAYLVELLSGEPYEQYITNNIFIPLGMTSTDLTYTNYTLAQLAKQYYWNSSAINEQYDFTDFSISAPGSLGINTNVEDFSKFLIVHMNGGVCDGVRILEESTVSLMHTNLGNDRGFGWDTKIVDFYQGHTGAWGGHTYMLTRRNSTTNRGLIVFTNQINNDFAANIEEIVEYILLYVESLPFDPDNGNFGFISVPIILVALGVVQLYIRRRRK
jgi:CubicO group peptidase (beta-lactamase class C family)